MLLLGGRHAFSAAPTGVAFTNGTVSSHTISATWTLDTPATQTPVIVISTMSDFSVVTSSAQGALGQQATSYTALDGITDNTSFYFKVKVQGEPEANYSLAISTLTQIGLPLRVYFAEVTTSTLVASAYAYRFGFSNLNLGVSGTDISRDGIYAGFNGGNSWTARADLMPARDYNAAAAANGRVYSFGGRIAVTEQTLTDEYDPATNSWTSRAAMPLARWGMKAELVNGKVYVIGGLGGPSVQEYDPITNTWSVKTSAPGALYLHGTAVVDGKIYAVGGTDAANPNYRYDPSTDAWTTLAALPTGRYGLAVGAVDGLVYAVGGAGSAVNEAYDPAAGTWNTRAPLPEALEGPAGIGFGGKMMVAGGSGSAGMRAHIQEYDPATNRWTYRASMANPRYYFSLAELDGLLYAVSGSAAPSMERYAPGRTRKFAGLAANTSYTFKARARNQNGDFAEPSDAQLTVSTYTAIQTPSSIVFDEIGAGNITALAYSTGGFSSLETGASGLDHAIGGVYAGFRRGNIWTSRAAVPTARYRAAAAAVGGKAYLAGGWTGAANSAVFEEYDPAADSWASRASMSGPRHNVAAAAVLGRVHVLGLTATNEAYDPVSNAWTTLAPLPTVRDNLSAVSYGDRLYAIGGHIGGTPSALVERYDPLNNSWTTLAAMPTARFSMGCAAAAGKIHCAGGNGPLTTHEAYDPAANTWATKAALPVARASMATVGVGGKLFLAGGDIPAVTATTIEYDPVTDAWKSLATMATARTEAGGALASGKVYVLGGTADNATPLTTNEEYDPGSRRFTGLTPNTQYAFKARARNAGGYATGEVAASTWTAAAYPSALNATILSTGGFSLAWTGGNGPEGLNPGGTQYEAEVSTKTDFSVRASSGRTTGTSFGFGGLIPNTTYYARARAFNSVGASSGFSLALATMTLSETPTSVYIDEVSTGSIVASAYASSIAFRNGTGGWSGVAIARDGVYSPFFNGQDWTAKTAMPTARAELAGAVVRNRLYAIGGHSGAAHLNTNEEYDPATDSWSAKAAMPTARGGLSAAVLYDKIYALGKGRGAEAAGNQNEEYDPVANTWAVKAAMPTARAYLAAVTLGDKIHAIGGWTGSVTLTVNEQYDPQSDIWTTKTALPSPRSDHAAAVVSGQAYVIGGYNGPNLNLNQRYDPGSDAWTSLAVMPTARYGHMAAAVGGKISVIGGTNGGGLGTIEEYDPAADAWATRPPLPSSRQYSGVGVIRGKIYLAGQFPASTSLLEFSPGVSREFTGLSPNTLYAFKAKTRNGLGAETTESPTFSTYTAAAIPGAVGTGVICPAGVPTVPASAFTSVSVSGLTAGWICGTVAGGTNPSGTQYRAQISTNSSFNPVWASATLVAGYAATFSSLSGNTTYYARVQAVNGGGFPSAFFTIGSTVTHIETPTSVYFDEISTGSVTASAYVAGDFTNLESGFSATNHAIDAVYAGWGAGSAWRSKTAMPTARGWHGAAASGGRLYAIGGWAGAGSVGVNEEYDPVSNSWASRAAMPTPRNGLGAAAVAGKIYAVGGDGGLQANEEYDPVSNAWAVRAVMPTPRTYLSLVAVGERLYAIGGTGGLAKNEMYDPILDLWTTKANMPTGRSSLAGAVLDGRIYALGGSPDGFTRVPTNEAYDPGSDSWAAKASVPASRADFGAAVLGGLVRAVGGGDGGPSQATHYAYDPGLDSWIVRQPMLTAREGLSLTALEGRLYALGGYNAGDLAVNEQYDPGVSHTFTGLSPNTLYAFKAKARNTLGAETPESPTVSTYTLAAVPGSAASTFTAVSNSALTAAWTAGTAAGGINPGGTQYEACLSTSSNFSVLTSSGRTTSTSLALGGLAANTTYYLRARAFNAYGRATPYTVLGSTITLIESPTALVFEEILAGTVTVSAYAPGGFTGLGVGLAATNHAVSGTFAGWEPGESWTARAAMPTLRGNPAVASTGGRIYAIGGYPNGPGVSAANEEYDPVADSWASRAAMPTARAYHAAAAAEGVIYVVGGDPNLAVNEAYDPAANAWTTKAPMPGGMGYLAAASYGRKIYALGGYNGATHTGVVREYDTAADAWTAKASLSTARTNHAAAAVGGRIYVAGGVPGVGPPNVAGVEAYDPAADAWVAVAALPTPVNDAAAVSLNGQFYIIGGMDNGFANSGAAQVFDPGSGRWRTRAVMPSARRGLGAAAAGGKIYAVGGDDGGGGYVGANQEFASGASRRFNGLAPNTLYAFSAKARNQVGTETDQVFASTYTAAALPGFAASTFTAVSSAALTVSWTAGSPAGGVNPAGTLYRLELSTMATFAPLSVSSQTFSVSMSTVGLQPFTTYHARVRAINAHGLPTAYVALGSTTTTAGPPAGGTLSSALLSVTATWTSAAPVGTAFYAQVARDPAFSSVAASSQTRNQTATLSPLTANTSYYARLAVFDAATSTWTAFVMLGATATHVENTARLSFDEVTANAITLAGVADLPGFSNLHVGLSGTEQWKDGVFSGFHGGSLFAAAAAMPTARLGLAAAAASGRLYALGGASGATALVSNEEYDPATDSWAVRTAMPTPRFGLAAVAAHDKIFAVGGSGGGGALDVNEEYDPVSDAWTPRASMPTPRQGLAAVALSDNVYAIGGTGIGGYRAELQSYDPITNAWTTRADMPTARYGLAAAVVEGRIFAVGGSDGAVHERYDPNTDSWTTLAAPPAAWFSPAAAAVGGRMHVLGGYIASYEKTQWEYDPGGDSWRQLLGLTTARQSLGAAAIGGAIYAVGGSNGATLASLERYDSGSAKRYSGLTPNSTFRFMSRARSQLGNETAFSVLVATRTAAAVPGVAPLAYFPVTAASFTARWSSGTMAEGHNPPGTRYEAQISTSGDFTTVIGTSVTLNRFAEFSGLSLGVYHTRARAFNADGRSTRYYYLGPVTLTNGIAAAAFSNVTAASLRANWFSGLGTGITYLTTLSSGPLPNAFTGNASSNTLNVFASFSGLSPDTTYYARLSTNVTGPFTDLGFQATLAAAPSGSAAGPIFFTSATITWAANGNPLYTPAEIERSTDNVVFFPVTSTAGVTSYVVSGLMGCTTYNIRLRYAGLAGDTAYDAVPPFLTGNATSTPAIGFTAAPVAGNKIALSWTASASPDVASYRLYGDGGTTVVDYGTPLAVFTSTETAFTTGVLVSSPSYQFGLRATNACGVEEPNVTVLASAAALAAPTTGQAAIQFPVSGSSIKGDRVSIVSVVQADSVLFEYRPANTGPWLTVPTAGAGEVNPVVQRPFGLHWDVTALADGPYELRAVSTVNGSSDTAPSAITINVTSDPLLYDVKENSLGGGRVEKIQTISNAVGGAVFALDEGSPQLTMVQLPAGSLDDPETEITVVNKPAAPGPVPEGAQGFDALTEITLANGQTWLANGETATLSISYPDANDDGIVDGTGIRVEDLRMFSFDPNEGTWVGDLVSTVDPVNRVVTAQTPHFSVFGLFAPAVTDLSGAQIYPNPYRPNGPDRDQGRPFNPGDPNSGIIFDRLPASAIVEIYSLTGMRVARLQSYNGSGRIQWSATTDGGRHVATGGYFVVISVPGQKDVKRKIAIIR